MKFRKLIAAFILILLASSSKSQLKPASSGGSIRNDIQTIIDDYRKGFPTLKGEVIAKNPQSTEYASLLKPDNAAESIITEYSYNKNAVYSWHAVMLETEDFDEAAKKYKALFSQLKGMTITLNFDYTFTLKGEFEAPNENKKFFSSVCTLLPAGNPLQKLKVEVEMKYNFPEWKVSLLIYELEREDDERGKIKD